jgi:hypothetical protein
MQQAQVRRHDIADGQTHDIARHELGDIDRHRLAVAHRQRGVTQLGVQRLDRQLGAVLVEKPQPDAQTDDQKDDRGAGALTHGKRSQRRGHEQDQQRIAQLTCQHRERARAMAAQSVSPDLGQPHPCLVVRQASGCALQAPKDIVGRERRGRHERQRPPGRPPRRRAGLIDGGHRPMVARQTPRRGLPGIGRSTARPGHA